MAQPASVVGSEFPTGAAATLGAGLTLLHQAQLQAGTYDTVTVWATNTDTVSDQTLKVFWAGDVDPDNVVTMTIPVGAGPCNIIPGWPLQRGKTVKALASAAGVINVATIISPISTYQR